MDGDLLSSRPGLDSGVTAASCLEANTSATRVSPYRLAWQHGREAAQHVISNVRKLYFFVSLTSIFTLYYFLDTDDRVNIHVLK